MGEESEGGREGGRREMGSGVQSRMEGSEAEGHVTQEALQGSSVSSASLFRLRSGLALMSPNTSYVLQSTGGTH